MITAGGSSGRPDPANAPIRFPGRSSPRPSGQFVPRAHSPGGLVSAPVWRRFRLAPLPVGRQAAWGDDNPSGRSNDAPIALGSTSGARTAISTPGLGSPRTSSWYSVHQPGRPTTIWRRVTRVRPSVGLASFSLGAATSALLAPRPSRNRPPVHQSAHPALTRLSNSLIRTRLAGSMAAPTSSVTDSVGSHGANS